MTTFTRTATTTQLAGDAPRPSRFTHTLASEWVKLASQRATHITLALALVLSVGTSALASLAVAATQDPWPADLDRRVFWLVGNIFTLIISSVFGVLAATREYSSGTIRLTLTATPRRGRVFCAKLGLVFLVILVCGLIATAGMFLAAQAVMGWNGQPVMDLGDPDARRTILGMGAVMPFFPVLGFAIGILFRSAAGAITTVLGLIWLPEIFGPVLPAWGRENIVSLLPGPAVDSFTLAHIVESPSYSDPAVGALIAGAWLVAIVGAAYIAFVRRDA
ncbi:MAG: ABC transporter permease [Dehalococcoidia bacterium]